MRSGNSNQQTGRATGPTCRATLPNGVDRELAGVASIAVSSSSSCHAAHTDALGVGAVATTRGNHRRRSANA